MAAACSVAQCAEDDCCVGGRESVFAGAAAGRDLFRLGAQLIALRGQTML